MDSYKELYFFLFGAMDRAMVAMEHGNTLSAYQELETALQEAEDAIVQFDIFPEQ